MSVNRMISISEEINEKLKREENASALISNLLNNYYKFNLKKVEYIEKSQKQIEEDRKRFIEQYSEDYAILEKKKQMIKQEEETIEQQKEKIQNKKDEIINNIKQNFFEDIGRYMTEKEINDYLHRWGTEKGFNYFIYLDEMKKTQNI